MQKAIFDVSEVMRRNDFRVIDHLRLHPGDNIKNISETIGMCTKRVADSLHYMERLGYVVKVESGWKVTDKKW